MSKSKYPGPNMEIEYHLRGGGVQMLEGQILTLIEAVTADPEQRKAIKDIVRPMIWQWIQFADINPANHPIGTQNP